MAIIESSFSGTHQGNCWITVSVLPVVHMLKLHPYG